MRQDEPPKELIVNADDFGAGKETDRGILQAFRQGIVTSASLLANGPNAAEAARMASASGLPVGVHLNLADGMALTGPISGLTDTTGRFPGKAASRHYLRKTPSSGDLRRELAAQIDRVIKLGLTPDHLDSHQHCFLFPPVCDIIFELAETRDIPTLRLPKPAEPAANDPGGMLGEELAIYRELAPPAAAALRNRPLDSPLGLFGMPLLNRLDEEALLRTLELVPPGRWELMVHPGLTDDANPFGGRERERELDGLCAPRVRSRLAELSIQLITFGDLA